MNGLRRNQIITTYGFGTIIELINYTGVLGSPEYWEKNNLPIDEFKKNKIEDLRLANRINNLQLYTGIKYFLPPGLITDDVKLPFYVFPQYLFCKKCNTLKKINNWIDQKWLPQNGYMLCNNKFGNNKCNGKLIPSRFVIICPSGHLNDFPYNEWVHRGRGCEPAELRIENIPGPSSLASIKISCKKCNKSRTMEGSTTASNLVGIYSCEGYLPELNRKEECSVLSEDLKIVLRNASNLYYPITISSITIPPLSEKIYNDILNHSLFDDIKGSSNIEDDAKEFIRTLTKILIKKYPNENENTIKNKIDFLLNPNFDTKTEENFRFDEYNAFYKTNEEKTENYIAIQINHNINKHNLDKIVKIIRLREIKVLLGYSRIKPIDINNCNNSGDSIKLRKIQNKTSKWLPGVENYGEGVFISFDNERMFKYEKDIKVIQRYNKFLRNLKTSYYKNLTISSRFIALHTFAHILLKRLSFNSGYSLASMRERIFCNNNDPDNKMNGILLYTVDSDIDGTMGGLCDLAQPERLTEIINTALEESHWCSNDPICYESSGQGMDSLNLAACHSCALLPETSCEFGNKFLDRAIMHYFFDEDET